MTRKEKIERGNAMAAMFRQGQTQGEIAAHFGVDIDTVTKALSYRELITPKAKLRLIERGGAASMDAITIIADRDTCWRCGVRADQGCVHRPKDEGPPPWARPVGQTKAGGGVASHG